MSDPGRRRQRGMTLIELIIFVVVVSVGLAGIMLVLDLSLRHSADPLLQKQAQALAEGLLEEIQTAHFAYCDGADPQLKYANDTAGKLCSVSDSYGPEAGETRPYDTVKDYASAADTPTALATLLPAEASIAAPAGYTAVVTIGPAALGDITDTSDVTDHVSPAKAGALLIKVVVSGPGGESATAEGFKTRQVPQ
jgi:MSHA pilin protein MshD